MAKKIGSRCHECNTTYSPQWRRGPDGPQTLCNKCGIKLAHQKRKELRLKPFQRLKQTDLSIKIFKRSHRRKQSSPRRAT